MLFDTLPPAVRDPLYVAVGLPIVAAQELDRRLEPVRAQVDSQLDVLIAGDDEAAKDKVSQLAADGGLRPIDVGPLSRAQQLEQLGFLNISLQQPLGLNFGSAVKLVMP